MPPVLKKEPHWGTRIQAHESMEDMSHSNHVEFFYILKANLIECLFFSGLWGPWFFVSRVEGFTGLWELELDMGLRCTAMGNTSEKLLFQLLVRAGWT